MDASAILAKYGQLKLADANEAETRQRVIDEVIKFLGWDYDDYTLEETVSEDGSVKYADYIFRTASTGFVIEAKRAGAALYKAPSTRRVSLQGEIMTGDTGQAIRQALEYARKKSIPFAVVTNGDCWVIFPGARADLIPFAQSSAIVFPSLKSALADNFDEFFAILSREAVINGSLERQILRRPTDQIEIRRLNRVFPGYISFVRRNSVYPLIENAINHSFTDNIVEDSVDLLEKCYVNAPNKLRFDSQINMYVRRRVDAVTKDPIRPLHPKDRKALADVIEGAMADVRPLGVVVLGRVGAGKTTFLKYTQRVSARDLLNKSDEKAAYWIHVDFLRCLPQQEAATFIYRTILEFINAHPFLSDARKVVQPAYRADIESFTRGPLALIADDEKELNKRITDLIMADYEKVTPYVDRILSYLTANVPVFIVVDNVDQIEILEEQSRVFTAAMSVAERNKASLIIAMRDTTYVQKRHMATIDAYEFESLYIDAPEINAVLSARFFVAREMLKNKAGEFLGENGITIKIADCSKIIDLVQYSVLSTEVARLIEVLAGDNVRLALRMVREFLKSGYTATARALTIYTRSRRYLLPAHEAMRAIILGPRAVYEEEHSLIGNPFDSRLSRTNAQLLRLFVLNALVNMSQRANFVNLPGDQAADTLKKIGFGNEIAQKVLADLCELRFIETETRDKPDLDACYVPTRLGGYIVKAFISQLVFLENMLMDTFIADNGVWDALKSLTRDIQDERNPTRRLRLRKQRVISFFEHIALQYKGLQREAVRRVLEPEWCQDPFDASRDRLNFNLQRALRSSITNYGSGVDQKDKVPWEAQHPPLL